MNIEQLPQNGGVAQNAEELTHQGQSDDSRFIQLFAKAINSNLTEFISPQTIPSGRDENMRINDSMSIAGLNALISNGLIDSNTIVIGHHGHPDEIHLSLLRATQLDVQGGTRNKFGSDGYVDAESSLDQAQTYRDSIESLQRRGGTGGALYLGIDAHGTSPLKQELPSAAEIREVMGENAKIVVLTEGNINNVSGAPDKPYDWEKPETADFKNWLREMSAAGISVVRIGINGRSDNPLIEML
jgi:hypothetical protein